MSFIYQRTVRFQDTDAAGVVYFANVLAICHEAYEASLEESGIDLKRFFQGKEIAFPIAHADVDFFAPMFCGDRLVIHLTPKQLRESEFEIAYQIFRLKQPEKVVSNACTRHVCVEILPDARRRMVLPEEITSWLQRWG